MRSRAQEKAPALNIRIKTRQRSLIEKAAHASNKTVSDFVRDAALREAQNTMLDRKEFSLDAAAWERFTAALDAVPASNPRLRDLVSRQAPWEQ